MKQNGVSLLIFPEGGRSVTGEMEPFKDGAAYLAIKGEVPILPVAIIGIRDVLPMHSHHIRPGRVTIRIGKPIETTGLHSHDRNAITQRIYDEIAAMRHQGHAVSHQPFVARTPRSAFSTFVSRRSPLDTPLSTGPRLAQPQISSAGRNSPPPKNTEPGSGQKSTTCPEFWGLVGSGYSRTAPASAPGLSGVQTTA